MNELLKDKYIQALKKIDNTTIILDINEYVAYLQYKIYKAIDLLETFKSNSKDVENEWAVEICELSIRKLKEK